MIYLLPDEIIILIGNSYLDMKDILTLFSTNKINKRLFSKILFGYIGNFISGYSGIDKNDDMTIFKNNFSELIDNFIDILIDYPFINNKYNFSLLSANNYYMSSHSHILNMPLLLRLYNLNKNECIQSMVNKDFAEYVFRKPKYKKTPISLCILKNREKMLYKKFPFTYSLII